MTSNQSISNTTKYTFKQGLKSLSIVDAVAMFGVIGFFTTFFSLIELFTKRAIYDENGLVTGFVANKDDYHFLLFAEGRSTVTLLLVAIAVIGVLTAVTTFNFITSKKMVNVYYSLGITRTNLFCGKYFSGLLLIFIAVSVPMIVLFFGNVATVGFSLSLLKAVMFYFFKFFLTAASSYTITAAIFAMVGTTFETAIFSLIILFLPDILLYCIQMLMDVFLFGNPYGHSFVSVNEYTYISNGTEASLTDRFSFLSPVFWGKSQIIEFGSMAKNSEKELVPTISPDFKYVLIWVVICVAIFFLVIWMFNRRKAEICGFIGTNRYLNSAVSLTTGFSVYCIVSTFVDTMVLRIVLGIVAFSVVHLLLEIIVLRDMKKFVRGLYKLPIGILVSVGVMFSFYTGFFGFTAKIPDTGEIESVAVTSVGKTNEYGLFGEDYSYFSFNELGYYFFNGRMVGGFKTEKDIKAVVEANQSIVDSDESERIYPLRIQFVYTLKNGKTFKRNYEGISAESYKKLLYLEDSDCYTEHLVDYFKGEISTLDKVNSTDDVLSESQKNLRNASSVVFTGKYCNSQFEFSLNNTTRKKLLDAIYKDLLDRTVDEKYYPAECPIGYMYFNGAIDSDYDNGNDDTSAIVYEGAFSARYDDIMSINVYNSLFSTFITTDMTNTINVLKDLGLYDKLVASPTFVSATVFDAQTVFDSTIAEETYILNGSTRYFVSKYSSAKPTNGQDWEYYDCQLNKLQATPITDKKVIEQLLACSYTAYEQDNIDTGDFVVFKTAEGDELLCFIPEGKMPANIK